MYLNEAPYGGSYWGVGTAAKAYFDKSVKRFELSGIGNSSRITSVTQYLFPFHWKK